MKKIINQIKNKITFYKFFLCATIFGIIILVLSIVINFKYTYDMTKYFEKNQVKMESIIRNITLDADNKSPLVIKNIEIPNDDFIKQYYIIQSDWLNKWLTTLAIIMAILGIMIPICFVKFLENKEKEMDRIIEDTKKQREDMQLQVNDVSKKYDEIKQKAKQVSDDIEKVKSYLDEINIASDQSAKDLKEVKQYVNEMRAISKYNEGLNKAREAENNETKLEEVLQLYMEASKLDPKNAKYLYVIGNLYAYIHKNDEAITYLMEAINIEPTARCYNNLAIVYQDKKDYNKALEYLDMAIDAEDSTDIYKAQMEAIKILVYSQLKDEETVTIKAQNLLKRNIEARMIYENIGLAYMNIEKYEQAIEILENSNKKYPLNKSYYNLTEAYLYTGKFEKAWNLIQESTKDKNSKFTYIFSDDYKKWLNILNNAEPQTDVIENIRNFIKDESFEKRDREDDK